MSQVNVCTCWLIPILAAMHCGIATAGDVADLVVFRNTLRPGSAEADEAVYQLEPWKAAERDQVLAQLNRINELAPGLLVRGASDGTISVYLAKLRSYAKGGPKRILLDRRGLPVPGRPYSYRILLHELVHTADCYDRLSGSDFFRRIIEPRIEQARKILEDEGLTPVTAASLPLGDRRRKLEQRVRRETGLPGVYASANLTECLAEIVSFWVAPEFRYSPPEELKLQLQEFVAKGVPPEKNDIAFRRAATLFRARKYQQAISELDPVIESQANFYQATSLRGYAHERLNRLKDAERDLRATRDAISPYQHGFSFYDREWQRVKKLID